MLEAPLGGDVLTGLPFCWITGIVFVGSSTCGCGCGCEVVSDLMDEGFEFALTDDGFELAADCGLDPKCGMVVVWVWWCGVDGMGREEKRR